MDRGPQLPDRRGGRKRKGFGDFIDNSAAPSAAKVLSGTSDREKDGACFSFPVDKVAFAHATEDYTMLHLQALLFAAGVQIPRVTQKTQPSPRTEGGGGLDDDLQEAMNRAAICTMGED